MREWRFQHLVPNHDVTRYFNVFLSFVYYLKKPCLGKQVAGKTWERIRSTKSLVNWRKQEYVEKSFFDFKDEFPLSEKHEAVQ